MRLLLIRHAQSANNALPEEQRVEDPSITPLGRRQATLLGQWLAHMPIDYLVTSPFRRSLETTELVRSHLRLTPKVWTDLHEQGGCYAGYEPGALEGRPGMSRRQIEASFPGYDIEPSIDGHGWWNCRPYESIGEARRRARRLIARTLREFPAADVTVAYVMHADFKRLFLSELFAESGHGDGWPSIYNTAVTIVEFSDSEPRLVSVNIVEHLPPELLSL